MPWVGIASCSTVKCHLPLRNVSWHFRRLTVIILGGQQPVLRHHRLAVVGVVEVVAVARVGAVDG